MNGRMYDPVVGRFLSPDPYVQNPGYTQSYNRYSYCLNNPLKYADPNGEFFLDPIVWLGNYLINWLDNTLNKEMSAKEAFKQTPIAINQNYSPSANQFSNPQAEAQKTARTIEKRGVEIEQNISNIGQNYGEALRDAESKGGNFSVGSTEQALMLTGIGLSADWAQAGADIFQQSNKGILRAAVKNELPTANIKGIMRTTGEFSSGAKLVGRSVILLSAGISVYQGYDAYTKGDMSGVGKAGLDLGVGLGTAAIGGLPGVLIYGTYMLIMAPPPGFSSGYVTPFGVRDNTYVAPVIPNF